MNFFNNLKISHKIILLGLTITAIFTTTIFVWILPEVKSTLIEKNKNNIQEQTEVAWSIIQHYHNLEVEGVLLRSAGQPDQ